MSKVLRTVGTVAGIVATVALALGHPEVAAIANAVSAPAQVGTQLRERPMTAINIFHDDRRAYLATDTAAFWADTGRIAQFRPKFTAWPGAHMAIAISGNGTPDHLRTAVEHVAPQGTQAAILKAMPAALRLMNANVQRDIETEFTGLIGTQRLYIAAYDRNRAKPRLYAIASDPDPTAPEAVPYVLRELRAGFVSGLSPDDVARALPAGYITNPKEDARRLLCRQRHHRFDSGYYAVGGSCEFVTVSRRGVDVVPILQFPETMGELVDPARLGTLIA